LAKSEQGSEIPGWSARFLGGPGNDRINAVDTFCDLSGAITSCETEVSPFRDFVSCGTGRDTARLDALDRVLGGCERRSIRR